MKYFGKDGIVTKLDEKVCKIIDKYKKIFKLTGTSFEYRLDENNIYVTFERTCYGCTDIVDGLTIDEAMLQNPQRELKKLFEETEKEKRRKQWREAKRKQRDKEKEERKLYEKLKKKYEK